MKTDPQLPISPPEQRIHYGYNEDDYDSAKDAGKLPPRRLVGGSWVTEYEYQVEFWAGRLKAGYSERRVNKLQRAIFQLELAHCGYWMEVSYEWHNMGYRLHKIGVRKS